VSVPSTGEGPTAGSSIAEPELPRWLRIAIPVGGVVVAGWGALVLALVGAFYTPLRVFGIPMPLSVVLVVLGLTGLMRFTYDVTQRVPMTLIPAGVWLVITMFLAGTTHEGDLVLIQQVWMGTVYLLAGSATCGLVFYRMLNNRGRILRRQTAPRPAVTTVAKPAAGPSTPTRPKAPAGTPKPSAKPKPPAGQPTQAKPATKAARPGRTGGKPR
jgi:hypothetical protein